MLAAAELLNRGGERVGLMGLTQPSGSRKIASLIAEAIIVNAQSPLMTKSRPPQQQVPRSELDGFGSR